MKYPSIMIIDVRKAERVFIDWHVDEATDRAEARNYARRLITRLKQEAEIKSVMDQTPKGHLGTHKT